MPENTTDTQQADAQEAQDTAVDQTDTTEKETEQTQQPEKAVEKESEREPESPEEDDAGEGEDDDAAEDEAARDRDAEKLVAKLRKKNTENQKLRARATEAESKLMRFEVASELGLPLYLAERLKGDTPDELKKDAEEFLQHIAPASVLGFVPDDGRRSGVEGEVKTPSLSEIGARMYER